MVLRRDYNAYWKVIAEETKGAATCGDTRLAEVGEGLLERDGNVIADQARRLYWRKEHFRELLNYAPPPNAFESPADTPAAKQCLYEVNPPSLGEVCAAIRQLHNNRIPKRFTRRTLTPWVRGCIGLSAKVGQPRLSQVTVVRLFFSSFQEGGQANMP